MNRTRQGEYVSKIQFLGEQDGSSERELKARLVVLFSRRTTVRTAYLARVVYGKQSPVTVALCLRAQPGLEQPLVAAIGGVFSEMFSRREHLDIFFLDAEGEVELMAQCRPFFSQ
jgi:hypothetical protein